MTPLEQAKSIERDVAGDTYVRIRLTLLQDLIKEVETLGDDIAEMENALDGKGKETPK